MPLNLRVGVLVIGSLDWESKDYGWACEQKPHRVRWRAEHLRDDEDSIYFVSVPIRYGRRSGSRNGTYTMVISPEYASRPGVGKVIRCRRDIHSADDLIDEAEQLWGAEDEPDKKRVSKAWGCVALMTPPDFLETDKIERASILQKWAARTASEPRYGKMNFSERDLAAAGKDSVIKGGCLQIQWPRQTNGEALPLDLLVLTATNPEIGVVGKQDAYPDAQQIAAAWNANGHVYYFRCNRFAGIHTADDAEIEKYIGRSDNVVA